MLPSPRLPCHSLEGLTKSVVSIAVPHNGDNKRSLQRLHHPTQGRGRTAHLRLQAQTHEKLTHGIHGHAALATETIERRRHQPRQPMTACLSFLQP